MAPAWIDTHCHLDAPEFDADRPAVLARAQAAGVGMQVLPAVMAANFDTVRQLAHAHGLAYALGIHPLYVDRSADADLDILADALDRHRNDPRLVAVGEIGLDFFVPGLDLARAERFYQAQLKLARAAGLPVILHVRRSADGLLKGLRRTPVPDARPVEVKASATGRVVAWAAGGCGGRNAGRRPARRRHTGRWCSAPWPRGRCRARPHRHH